MGCETAVANGGASGIQMGKAFRPHLAIVDVHAFEAEGNGLVERLARELPMKPILAAYPGTGPVGHALEKRLAVAGVDRIIPAPMDPTLLADVLQECQAWWRRVGAGDRQIRLHSVSQPTIRLSIRAQEFV